MHVSPAAISHLVKALEDYVEVKLFERMRQRPALALQAAADGLGVALAMDAIAADDIAAGRLVAPFDLSIPLRGPDPIS